MKKSKSEHIVLVSIPRLTVDGAPLSIAQLKPGIVNAGFDCTCVDVNIKLRNYLTFEQFLEIDNYFQADLRYIGRGGDNEIDFLGFHDGRLKELSCLEQYKDYIKTETQKLLDLNPTWIGFSVFSVNSVIPAIDFCKEVRKRNDKIKIVLGGSGVSSFGLGTAANFGEFMFENDLTDYYISGEGELSIVELLKSGSVPPQKQIDDLDSIGFADYSDFNLYDYNANGLVYITGSRGCVRDCTFCDIKSLWKKYRYRSGEHIAQEVIEAYNKWGSIEFYFTDSLINGNVKEFMKFCTILAEEKDKGNLPDELSFGGQYICRPKKQVKEEHYKIMARAGMYNLSVGIESGSDAVLADMKKQIKRTDYDFMLEMFSKYGIRTNLLMVVGYPTETENDFQQTLDMFKDYKKYSDNGIIWGLNLGKTLVVLPGARLGYESERWDIHWDEDGNWISRLNPTLTYNERVKRRIKANRLCEELGYVIKSQVTTINSMHAIVTGGGYDTIS